jgi:DNA-binding response OmpR family regulator
MMAKRVLIVEDDVATAIELEASLQDAGFLTLGPAFDPGEASELLSEQSFDAAILDLSIVSEMGLDLSQPSTLGVPILYMTGQDGPVAKEHATASEVVLKPCRMDEIVARLRVALRET